MGSGSFIMRLKGGSSNVYGVTGVSYLPMDLGMSGWASNNGLSNTLGYDGDERLTGITVPGVESLGFSYDADNRITHIANGIDNSLTESLGYDTLGRLQSEASAVQNATYGYDADGNRITQTLNGAATNFAYPVGSNRLASASGGLNATYGYDADGNTTTVNGLTAYSYGPFNRLVNAGGTHHVVSAEGQRLEKSGGGNITYFAPGGGGAMLADDANGTWMDYVWLNGRLVSLVKSGSVYAIHDDQTGRPIAVTAPNQAVVWSAAGLPFDRQVTANTFGDFNIGFPGQYFDSETGLYQNGARDYDASLGRFIESDPIGLAGGVNTYTYVGNDPLNYIDPLGLCCTKAQKEAAKAAKVLATVSNAYGNAALGAGAVAAGSAIYGGFVGEADLPVTAVSAEVGETSGAISEATGIAAAGLNTYASGWNFRYFVKFGVDNALKMVNSRALGHVPGMDHLAKFYSDLTTRLLGSFVPDSLPCGEQ